MTTEHMHCYSLTTLTHTHTTTTHDMCHNALSALLLRSALPLSLCFFLLFSWREKKTSFRAKSRAEIQHRQRQRRSRNTHTHTSTLIHILQFAACPPSSLHCVFSSAPYVSLIARACQAIGCPHSRGCICTLRHGGGDRQWKYGSVCCTTPGGTSEEGGSEQCQVCPFIISGSTTHSRRYHTVIH